MHAVVESRYRASVVVAAVGLATTGGLIIWRLLRIFQ